MTGPGLTDAEDALRYAHENLDLAAAAGDAADRAGCYRQVAQALGNASRIFAGLASAAEPPAPPRGPTLNMPGAPARTFLG